MVGGAQFNNKITSNRLSPQTSLPLPPSSRVGDSDFLGSCRSRQLHSPPPLHSLVGVPDGVV